MKKLFVVIMLIMAAAMVACVKPDPITDIKMKGVTDITESTAVVHAKASASGGAEIAERGFMYGEQEPAQGTKVRCGSGTGEYEATLMGLEPGTEYLVLAYIIDGEGEPMGTHYIRFTTLGGK